MRRRIETVIFNPLVGSNENLPLPTYATEGSAALDLRACLADDEEIVIEPGEVKTIGTGFGVNMQDPGLEALVCSRSGHASKKMVFVLNAPGLIDSDYLGEIGVILANFGKEPFVVKQGDRIAQLMFQPVVQVALDVVPQFTTTTARGAGGFGSTGKA